ncbi:MAG: alpha/beta hydrolase [Rhodospirillaceae bacterium]|nr:alpha/beta hydrolase [Rhodospirillaceae bacterium]
MAAPATTEHHRDIGGTRTRYVEAGDGEPILFIHGGVAGDGALAQSAADWSLALAALAPRYRCIAFDRLGQGATAAPVADDCYTMAASVAHAEAFVASFAGESFHLVGHGHGGYVAAALALAAPTKVRSCTIVASDVAAPGNGRREFLLYDNPHPPLSQASAGFVLERMLAAQDAIAPDWLARIAAIFAAESYRDAAARMNEAGLLDTMFLPRLRADRDRLHARLAQAALGCPVMLVWGFDDPVAPMAQAYAAFDLLARHELRCELRVMNGAGHFPHREQPAAFHRLLANFVENVRHGV